MSFDCPGFGVGGSPKVKPFLLINCGDLVREEEERFGGIMDWRCEPLSRRGFVVTEVEKRRKEGGVGLGLIERVMRMSEKLGLKYCY